MNENLTTLSINDVKQELLHFDQNADEASEDLQKYKNRIIEKAFKTCLVQRMTKPSLIEYLNDPDKNKLSKRLNTLNNQFDTSNRLVNEVLRPSPSLLNKRLGA
ncbi:hypothetical protein QTO02_05955 [Vibrio fortis]